MYVTSGAQGEGFATVASDGGVLDAWFLNPKLTPGGANAGTQRVTGLLLPGQSADDVARYARKDDIRGVEVVPIRTEIACLADKPVDVHDVYLRLHLLSHRLVKPNAANIDGMFQLLRELHIDRIQALRTVECDDGDTVGDFVQDGFVIHRIPIPI